MGIDGVDVRNNSKSTSKPSAMRSSSNATSLPYLFELC
jgi:hypothetical protein